MNEAYEGSIDNKNEELIEEFPPGCYVINNDGKRSARIMDYYFGSDDATIASGKLITHFIISEIIYISPSGKIVKDKSGAVGFWKYGNFSKISPADRVRHEASIGQFIASF